MARTAADHAEPHQSAFAQPRPKKHPEWRMFWLVVRGEEDARGQANGPDRGADGGLPSSPFMHYVRREAASTFQSSIGKSRITSLLASPLVPWACSRAQLLQMAGVTALVCTTATLRVSHPEVQTREISQFCRAQGPVQGVYGVHVDADPEFTTHFASSTVSAPASDPLRLERRRMRLLVPDSIKNSIVMRVQ